MGVNKVSYIESEPLKQRSVMRPPVFRADRIALATVFLAILACASSSAIAQTQAPGGSAAQPKLDLRVTPPTPKPAVTPEGKPKKTKMQTPVPAKRSELQPPPQKLAPAAVKPQEQAALPANSAGQPKAVRIIPIHNTPVNPTGFDKR